MRRAVALIIACLTLVLVVHSRASATSLTDTALTDAQFSSFAGTKLMSRTSSFSFGLTSGTMYSAAFEGTGSLAGHTIYTYQLKLSGGVSTGADLSVGGLNNLVRHLNIDGAGAADSSFHLTGALTAGSGLQSFFGSNGLLMPITSLIDDVTGDFRTVFASIGAGASSSIFGYISDGYIGTVTASTLDATGGLHAGPIAVAPGPTPEPATLLLLGSGFTGMAAWSWRRRLRRRSS